MTAIFGKKDKSEEDKKSELVKKAKVAKKTSKKKTEKKKPKKVSENLIKKAKLVNDVIMNPIVSEDAMNKTTVGKYVFKVNPTANKIKVAEAIEVLYGVEVSKVNIMKYKPKKNTFRGKKGTKSGYKKAIVTVKAGQEIQLFSE